VLIFPLFPQEYIVVLIFIVFQNSTPFPNGLFAKKVCLFCLCSLRNTYCVNLHSISEFDSISQWFPSLACLTNPFKTKQNLYLISESDLCVLIDESFELLPVIRHLREPSLVV
jgi:hypothetical protein